MRNSRLFCWCLILVACGSSFFTPSTPANNTLPANTAVDRSSTTPQSATAIRIVGQWEAAILGRQILTTRSDGTATIAMSLTPFAIPIYGKNVELELRWTLDGERLTQHIVGGSPARSVEKLIRKFGATHEYLVVEHGSDHLLVKALTSDADPVRWTAVTRSR